MTLFDDIQGHDRIKLFFRHAVERERLYGSYLFTGPEGVGKRKTALAIAALMNCEQSDPSTAPCGACGSCIKIRNGHHVDVVTIAAESNEIKAEQVEPVMDALKFPPFEGRHRVIIIDNAHQLNPTSGNMMLKTLEEPPDRTHFFLITSRPDALLSTIRSRCQEVAFPALSPDQFPVPDGLDPALLSAWYAGGGGYVTDPEPVQESAADRTLALTVLKAMCRQTPAFRVQDQVSDALPANDRERTLRFFFLLQSLIRDVLVLHAGRSEAVLNRDVGHELAELARTLDPDTALAVLGVVNRARNRVFYNISIHQLITVMVAEGRKQVV